MPFNLKLNKLEPYQIISILGIAAGAFLFLTPQGKTILQKIQNHFAPPIPNFMRPPATNAYVPDPDISEWSYRNAVRKDYEALERLEKGIDIGGWNVGNLNPNWERHLQKKYGL